MQRISESYGYGLMPMYNSFTSFSCTAFLLSQNSLLKITFSQACEVAVPHVTKYRLFPSTSLLSKIKKGCLAQSCDFSNIYSTEWCSVLEMAPHVSVREKRQQYL